MENFIMMAQLQGLLLMYMVIGYTLRKKNLLEEQAVRGVTNMLIYVLLPCMIFNSFKEASSQTQWTQALHALCVAFAVSLLSMLFNKWLYQKYPDGKKSILRYGTLVPNSAFAGLPLAKLAYGDIGLFYASIYVIPTRIFMWSAGVSLFANASRRERIKNALLNPGMLAVAAGMLRMLLKIEIPPFLDKAIIGMGDSTSSISMMVAGAILADVKLESIEWGDLLYLSAVRLLAMPLLVLGICRLFGIDPVATAAGVILTGMPVGATTAILSKKYGADSVFASKCLFFSTVCSLITIPLLSLLL